MSALAKGVLSGDARSIARTISLLEDKDPRAAEVMRVLSGRKRSAWVLGVTGPPGVGKSTLVDRLIEAYRARRKTVGVVAVDPTSPFTGGALLGDRIRMQRHSGDAGVFMRSMGSRGHAGGLAEKARDVVSVLTASGKDVIIVETVGAGQQDVEVAQCAYTVLVVLMPELGDEVQLMKAGLVEIGDIFVVNKADQPGAEEMTRLLKEFVSSPVKQWKRAVLPTVATTGGGVKEVVAAVDGHMRYLRAGRRLQRRLVEQARAAVVDALAEMFAKRAVVEVDPKRHASMLMKVADGTISPADVARKLADGLMKRAT